MNASVRPLAGHVIVVVEPEPEKRGAIHMPTSRRAGTHLIGEVLAIGDNVHPDISIGTRVLMDVMSGHVSNSEASGQDLAQIFGVELPRRVVVVRCGPPHPAPIQEEQLARIHRHKTDLKKQWQGVPPSRIPEEVLHTMDQLKVEETCLKLKRKKAGRSRRAAPSLDPGLPEGVIAILEDEGAA
ncbi:MAG: hypothetical protein ACE366_16705 [Bradymonadia bacterium]